MGALAKELEACKIQVETILLSGNKIMDKIISIVPFTTPSIANIKHLHIEDCRINNHGMIDLFSKIKMLETPFQLLNIGGNKIDDDIMPALCDCLHKIERLKMDHIPTLSPDGMRLLTEEIKQLKKPMKLLNIGYTPMKDEGISFLSSCLFNLDELIAEGCEISNNGLETLSDSIKSLQNHKLKYLSLQDNNFEFSKSRSREVHVGKSFHPEGTGLFIYNCLINVERLNIGCVHQDDSNGEKFQNILSKIKDLPEPRPKLQWREEDDVGYRGVDLCTEGSFLYTDYAYAGQN